MASKRLKKKKQAAAVLQKQQPVQEKEPVTMEMEQNAQETENGGQDICFRMDVDLQQEEKEENEVHTHRGRAFRGASRGRKGIQRGAKRRNLGKLPKTDQSLQK